MNLSEQRAAEMTAAQALLDAAVSACREFTKSETADLEAHIAKIRAIDEHLANATDDGTGIAPEPRHYDEPSPTSAA